MKFHIQNIRKASGSEMFCGTMSAWSQKGDHVTQIGQLGWDPTQRWEKYTWAINQGFQKISKFKILHFLPCHQKKYIQTIFRTHLFISNLFPAAGTTTDKY